MATSCEDLVLNQTYTLDKSVKDLLFERVNPSRRITYVGEGKFMETRKEFLYETTDPRVIESIGSLLVEPCFIEVEGDVVRLVEFNGVMPHYIAMYFKKGEFPDQYSEERTRLDRARRGFKE